MAQKSLKHNFQSTTVDDPNVLLVRPQANWNAEHQFYLGYRYVSGISDTLTSSDAWAGVTYSNSNAITSTLDSTTHTAGFVTFITYIGASSVTITPTSGTINGAGSLILVTNSGVMLWCDGTDYYGLTSYDLSAGGYSGSSSTSVLIATGSQSFTASTGRVWGTGTQLIISSDADPTNYMHGAVTSYNAATGALVVDVNDIGGSGTYSDWIIELSGEQGPPGPATTTTRVVTTTSVTMTDSDEVVVINRTASGAITVSLPSVSTAAALIKEIYRFDGNTGDITVTPDGAETIMGLSSWVISCDILGGSLRLFPVPGVSGWIVR